MAQAQNTTEDEPEIKQSGDIIFTTRQVNYRVQLSIVNGEPILKLQLQANHKSSHLVVDSEPLQQLKRTVVEQILTRFFGRCMFTLCIFVWIDFLITNIVLSCDDVRLFVLIYAVNHVLCRVLTEFLNSVCILRHCHTHIYLI